MEEEQQSFGANDSDTATHAVITHLHARVIELEKRVVSLQQKNEHPQPTRETWSRWVQWIGERKSVVAARSMPHIQRVQRVLGKASATGTELATDTRSKDIASATDTRSKDTAKDIASATDTTSDSVLEEQESELAELPFMVRMTSITLVSMVLGWASEHFIPIALVSWAFYAIAYINGSFYSVQEAWESLKQRQFDVNLLMIAAALGAAVIGQPLEGAVLMFLFSLSQTLETFAMGRTHASLRLLMDITPVTARIVATRSGEEYEEEVPVEHLAIGSVVRVRPGEQVPADGVVIRGTSAVNEASITGESMPVEKKPDAQVFAGTLNGQGSIDVRVTTSPENSTLSRIVKIVSQAREQKARSQDFTDRVIGQYYAYTVVSITLLSIIIPLTFLGWDVYTTVYRAITLMVGASPCALVISIPAAILSALASASWNGVLFKGGRHLESASKVHVVAFDKTGTLTVGHPQVVAVLPVGDASELGSSQTGQGVGDEVLADTHKHVLRLAAAVERFSEHPLALAIVEKAQAHAVVLPQAEHFEAQTGVGVQAEVDGVRVSVGRPRLFEQEYGQTLTDETIAHVEEQERQGRTVVLVGDATHVWGIIAFADTVREESADAIADLKRAGVRHIALLTGDNRYVAERLAQTVGIDEVRAALTPEQKVEAVREIQATYGPVAMVGDGVNDAPALATASLGVAMGAAGTAVAMESADVVLMSDDLSKLQGTLRLARRTRRIVQQNVVFAFGVMVVLILLALTGVLPLTLATLFHEGSTLIVVANGLRLLAPWK